MKNKQKTVLVITSHYPPNLGGVESHLLGLVAALIKRNWRVIVSTYQPLASKKSSSLFEKQNGLVIYRLPWLGFNIVHKLTPYPALEFLYLFPGLFVISFFSLVRHLKEITVIHCQGLVPTAVGVLLGKLFSKRVISSIHNMYFFPRHGLYPLFAKQIFSLADRILGPTQLTRQELISIGVDENKISGFRYWLDLGSFSPVSKDKAKRLIGWRKFTVLFVGRLIETKGLGVLLKMIKTFPPGIQLVVIGDGPMKWAVEVAQKKSKNIVYLGRVENQNLPLYYSAADLVLVPSLVDEGWGFVAMEAISCGTPVLASQKGGLADVISAETGKLIISNAVSFKKWIEYFFHKKEELDKLTRNTRPYALKNFGEDSMEDILKTYEE